MSTTVKSRGYQILRFDDLGRELKQPGGSKNSEEILARLKVDETITDLFVFTHGWQAQLQGAYEQFDRWMTAIYGQESDHERFLSKTGGKFMPEIVGLHWPSRVGADGGVTRGIGRGFSADSTSVTDEEIENLVGEDAVDAFKGVTAILKSVNYDDLLALGNGEAGDRGIREGLDAIVGHIEAPLKKLGAGVGAGDQIEAIFSNPVEFAGAVKNLGPLFQRKILEILSFFRMRERARQIGAVAAHGFVKNATAVAANKKLRIHLAGHSFGCVVMSAAVSGPNTQPIPGLSSVVLVQGAISLWSYCGDDPTRSLPQSIYAGEYSTLLERVNGVVATTRSPHDRAVGTMYPIAAKMWESGDNRQKADYNIYGALGAYGARGRQLEVEDIDMLPSSKLYKFAPGKIYNVEAKDFIKKDLSLVSGAHCDIDNEGVAHLIYEAAIPR